MRLRFFYGFVLFLSLFFAPWFVTAALGLIGFVLFDAFFESVVIALIVDLLYGADNLYFYDFHFVMTLGAVIGLALSQFVRRFLRLPAGR